MRARRAVGFLLCSCVAGRIAPAAVEVAAEPPVELAVTIYRAPDRQQGSIDPDDLRGFALISETRMVRLPAGESRLRFEGVADGIEAQSAIITGLPEEIIEKNRDAKVLSPSTLLAAAAGKSVELLRTDRKTGKTEGLPGTILSDAGGGVVFSTRDGIEALRCSGLPESIGFDPNGVPPARPSLSVRVRSAAVVTRKVTLSYLSRGFDWAAAYTATLSADERSMTLGAWVTLANSNGTGFPSASTQVIAGRVNRQRGTVEPIDLGGPILAVCWPRGSTSDSPPRLLRSAEGSASRNAAMTMMRAMAMSAAEPRMRKVEAEQLGDLKLYRVPEHTTVASRQSKQIRLLDRAAIPVTTFYRAELPQDARQTSVAAERVLRTTNDQADHLGLPLPSGSIAVFSLQGGERLLLHETALRDLAIGEQVDIGLGLSPDVRVAATSGKIAGREQLQRVRVSNALPRPVQVELRVLLPDGGRLVRADAALSMNSREPMFLVSVPARGSTLLEYRLRFAAGSIAR